MLICVFGLVDPLEPREPPCDPCFVVEGLIWDELVVIGDPFIETVFIEFMVVPLVLPFIITCWSPVGEASVLMTSLMLVVRLVGFMKGSFFWVDTPELPSLIEFGVGCLELELEPEA